MYVVDIKWIEMTADESTIWTNLGLYSDRLSILSVLKCIFFSLKLMKTLSFRYFGIRYKVWTLYIKRNECSEKNEEKTIWGSPNPLRMLPKDPILPFCSSYLRYEGKDQIGGEKEPSLYCLIVLLSSILLLNDPKHKYFVGI